VTTYSVAAPTSVTISASYGGVSKTATLTVTPPSADTVTINLAQYWISKTQLRVNANSTSATATLEVYVTATDQFIGTLTNNGGKYSGKFFWPSNPQNITVRSSLGGSASKAVTVK
jgi:ABC-type sulfate transport system substrate-binding protein